MSRWTAGPHIRGGQTRPQMERDEAHRKLEPVTERLERIALALERIADRLDDEAVEEYRGLPHFL